MSTYLVHDEGTRKLFAQIVWVALGQEPNLAQLQESVHVQLTGQTFDGQPTPEEKLKDFWLRTDAFIACLRHQHRLSEMRRRGGIGWYLFGSLVQFIAQSELIFFYLSIASAAALNILLLLQPGVETDADDLNPLAPAAAVSVADDFGSGDDVLPWTPPSAGNSG